MFGLNVLDFGAIGNGIVDDTLAIQNAIDAIKTRGGGSLFFPKGDYKITGITIDASVDIELVGEHLTQITNADINGGDAISVISPAQQDETYVKLKKLRVRGNGNSGKGFYGCRCSNIVIEECYFKENGNTGIYMDVGTFTFIVERTTCRDNGYDGISLWGDSANNSKIINSKFIGHNHVAGACGIRLVSTGWNLVVWGNDIESNNYGFVSNSTIHGLNFQGNYVESNLIDTFAMGMGYCRNCVISGNFFNASGYNTAVRLGNSNYITVRNNILVNGCVIDVGNSTNRDIAMNY